MKKYIFNMAIFLLLLPFCQIASAAGIPAEYDEALRHVTNARIGKQKGEYQKAADKLKIALSKATTDDEKDEVNLLLSVCHFFMKDLDKSIECAQLVLQHNPNMKRNYPDQGIWHVNPLSSMGFSYYAKKDYAKANEMFMEHLKRGIHKAPAITILLSESRRKLTESGAAPTTSIAFAKGNYLENENPTPGGSLLVSASGIAEALGLNMTSEEDGETLVLSKGDKTLPLKLGSISTFAENQTVSLPIAPIKKEAETLIPLRFVAEYFGAKVKWDVLTKIAWIS